ncbi:rab-like GTPase activating protein [Trypanosoma theileri]|uniref:Rab-like GTPase activating protein n=1 Tax=Trypanosoma theileri TaxID=67003 RepID=A0A1X0NLM2_9TRYP|nr:rab-like GTPase activating protein [Trypanosoma theileri]ORC85605.1 rab-like GTPase activating protein [Trypanosoma theileri]
MGELHAEKIVPPVSDHMYTSTSGRNLNAPHGRTTDRFGFYITAKEKIAEDAYTQRHPESPEKQKAWSKLIRGWNYTSYETKKSFCREGIPQSFRRTVWPLLLNSYGWSLEKCGNYNLLKSQSIADDEVFEVIERDLGRTFPTHQWFEEENGIGRTKLRGILRAYANLDPTVGYVQGMGFLAATLLLQIEDEESTFWAFVSLMQEPKYGMAGIYARGFPFLYLRFYQLKKLMKRKCPSILKRIEVYGIDPTVYATNSYLTLFSYDLNFGLLSRIWDMFLCEGWKIIHRVIIALLLMNKKILESARDENELLLALRDIYHDKDPDMIIRKALKVKFKTAQLLRWEAKYRMTNK